MLLSRKQICKLASQPRSMETINLRYTSHECQNLFMYTDFEQLPFTTILAYFARLYSTETTNKIRLAEL